MLNCLNISEILETLISLSSYNKLPYRIVIILDHTILIILLLILIIIIVTIVIIIVIIHLSISSWPQWSRLAIPLSDNQSSPTPLGWAPSSLSLWSSSILFWSSIFWWSSSVLICYHDRKNDADADYLEMFEMMLITLKCSSISPTLISAIACILPAGVTASSWSPSWS